MDTSNSKATLLEWSIPFETNIDSTHDMKVNRYKQFVFDVEDNSFYVEYYPIKIGSIGFISKENQGWKYFWRQHPKKDM